MKSRRVSIHYPSFIYINHQPFLDHLEHLNPQNYKETMSRLGPERTPLASFGTTRGSADTLIARINARLLDQFKGQTIRLTAKVIKLSGDTATVEASDGGQVRLSYAIILGSHSSCIPSPLFILFGENQADE